MNKLTHIDVIILYVKEKTLNDGTSKNSLIKRRYIEDVFRKKAKMRPKTNSAIGELAYNVLVAIKQEEKVNNDIVNCKGVVTSNIGVLFNQLLMTNAMVRNEICLHTVIASQFIHLEIGVWN